MIGMGHVDLSRDLELVNPVADASLIHCVNRIVDDRIRWTHVVREPIVVAIPRQQEETDMIFEAKHHGSGDQQRFANEHVHETAFHHGHLMGQV
jgi:hypothetical protein